MSKNDPFGPTPPKIIRDITPGERKLLAHLSAHPALFLGRASLRDLGHFMQGYTCAMGVIGQTEQHNLLPEGLNEFTAEYLGVELSAHSYVSLILNNTPDDGAALTLFFTILDKYLVSLGFEPLPVWDDTVDSRRSYCNEASIAYVDEMTQRFIDELTRHSLDQ